jgi:outer membrane protein TolC
VTNEARRIAALVVAGLAVVVAVAEILAAAIAIDRSPRTDAVEIDAPFIHISPTTPGRVVKVGVADNAAVKLGDILFEIDPAPYQLRVDLAKAETEAAQSEVDQDDRNIAGERANATVADEQIRRARDNLALAEQSLARLTPLLPKGYVTAQQVDQATTARDDALVSLRQAEAQSSGANQVVGTLETRRAQLAAAEAQLALAQRDLDVSSSALPGVDVSLPGALGVGSHQVSAQASEVVPGASMQWLLFDFGGRAAVTESARQLSIASDVVFNGAHQKLIYEVASTFYQFTAARAQVAIATETLANAKFVYAAAQSRSERGIATTIEVAQAKQQVAQAQLGLVESQGFERDGYHALLKAMGVAPTLAIKVQDVSSRPLPRAPAVDLDRLVEAALRRRPD